ncbi:redox-regulated ATPase YchF [Candidatus Woesearchaeota archaeon]|nr:MAG: redox-regulated ATPase YchF [Candidatus Woesearchaeota archaeon]
MRAQPVTLKARSSSAAGMGASSPTSIVMASTFPCRSASSTIRPTKTCSCINLLAQRRLNELWTSRTSLVPRVAEEADIKIDIKQTVLLSAMLIGIVGKPSCGKSTFFKAATLAEVDIANYPFTTIKPNHAVGFVKIPDPAKAFGKTSNPRTGYVLGDWRFVPVDLIDVAGLVPGAHEGQGLGKEFLNDLNQADALIHVIDASGSVNEKGEPVPRGSYDPARDITFLEDELDYWYLDIMKKGWDKFVRQAVQEKRPIAAALEKQLSGLRVSEELARKTIDALGLDKEKPNTWDEDALLALARGLRKASKPIMIAANKVDVEGAWDNYERLTKQFPEYHIVPCSAELELALREAAKHGFVNYIPGEGSFTFAHAEQLTEQQQAAMSFIKGFLERRGSTGVQAVLNHAVFELLRYKPIFPGGVGKLEDSEGNVIPDCFLMPADATALDFAYRLHTDFGKNFVKAVNVKTKMPVGKDHVLEPGSIIEIMAAKR